MSKTAQSVFFVDDAHTFGGAQIAMGHAIRALIDHTSVSVLLITTKETYLSLVSILGRSQRIVFYECPPALPLNIFTFFWRIPTFWVLTRHLNRHSAGPWIFNLSGIEFCLAELAVLRLRGIRPYAWLHNPEKFSTFMKDKSLPRRLLSKLRDSIADIGLFCQYRKIITPSAGTGRYLSERAGRHGPPTTFVYPTITGIAPPSQSEAIADDQTMHLWMIGRIEYGHKNNVLALQLLQYLHSQGQAATLSVVGDGPDREKFLEDVTALGVASSVNFMGWRSDPWEGIPENAIVVIPSHWESICLVAIEALLRKRRLVLSPIQTFEEVYPKKLIASASKASSFAATTVSLLAMRVHELDTLYADTIAKFEPASFSRRFLEVITK